ncbi:MAG: AAA family ATPase [Anaerolineae bacterium]|nr:AAA family ATPase [Anaerolineae bacterium]
MLKHIYIDNYKSLVNFELSLDPINLFLGPNGSGKSAVFEALRIVRCFVTGESNIIWPEQRTRWQNQPYQTFVLEVTEDDAVYRYELSLEHDIARRLVRVSRESLLYNDRPLLEFMDGDVQLYQDDGSKGPQYPFDQFQSAGASISSRPETQRIDRFKKQLRRLFVVQINPSMMSSESEQEESIPSLHLENYVSWYRYLSQDQGLAYRLTEDLREVIPGFDHFRFEQFGETHRLLTVRFRSEDSGHMVSYRFGELSDGQRMLIALYTLLHLDSAGESTVPIFCLDEPENFIALPEIQPWLVRLYDQCTEGKAQALLISHHPELINYLLASPVGYWFDREGNRPTRVKRIAASESAALPPSELIARGWLTP